MPFEYFEYFVLNNILRNAFDDCIQMLKSEHLKYIGLGDAFGTLLYFYTQTKIESEGHT